MYINFISDRKSLEVLKDTSDSTVPRLLTPSKYVFYVFVRKLPSKVTRKSKRVIVGITLVSTLWFSNVQPAPARGLSIPPTPVVQPNYKHTYEMKVAPIVSPKLDKITFTK